MTLGLRLHRPGRLRKAAPPLGNPQHRLCCHMDPLFTRTRPPEDDAQSPCRAPFAAKLSGMSASQVKGPEALGRTLRSSALCRRIPAIGFPSGGGPGDLGSAPFLLSVQVRHDKTDIFPLSATISTVFCFLKEKVK